MTRFGVEDAYTKDGCLSAAMVTVFNKLVNK